MEQEPQAVEETKKKPVKKADLADQLGRVVDTLGAINDRLVRLEQETRTVAPPKVAAPPPTASLAVDRVPEEFQSIVAQELNPRFGITVEPARDTPTFTLSIVVPLEYSNEKPAYLELYRQDVRSKRISNAEGSGGVREWARRVFENFPTETRSLIVMDRLRT